MAISIGDLINKGNIDVSTEDEDYQFCLKVTAEWDNIVESVRYQ